MREADIQARCMMALSEAGCLVFRNNTGQGWAGNVEKGKGQMVFVGPNDVVVRNARPLRSGLCKGSSDVIGIGPDGRFLAHEIKTKTGRVAKAQLNFIEAVKNHGGRAGIARSPEDAVKIALGEI